MNSDDNSESGKNQSENIHDVGTTVKLRTTFTSNTDALYPRTHRQVSFQILIQQ